MANKDLKRVSAYLHLEKDKEILEWIENCCGNNTSSFIRFIIVDAYNRSKNNNQGYIPIPSSIAEETRVSNNDNISTSYYKDETSNSEVNQSETHETASTNVQTKKDKSNFMTAFGGK